MDKDDPDSGRVAKPTRKSLLERYDIPVEHLSYEYISECKTTKILERIVTILRSGEEGIYPDLTKHAEERLAVIKPTSIILRNCEPVRMRNMLDSKERKEIDSDINNWTYEMQSRERDLEEGKAALISEHFPQPDIRQFKEEIVKQKPVGRVKNSDKTKRISSCDYAAWDKYDVDTEITKIDVHEEQRQTEVKRFQEKQREMNAKKKTANDVVIDKASLTGTELDVMAEREKEKGNEAFRAGDFEEALRHYNTSIKIDSNLVTYNNRAMTFIKLQRYEDALNDCNLVLTTEYTNIKAMLRRAVSLEHLEKSSQALADYEAVLKLEPTNKTAIAAVKKLRKPCESRKVRMIIEEKPGNVDRLKHKEFKENNSQSDVNRNFGNGICFCDRAPGPSKISRPRPHLKADYCLENDVKQRSIKNGLNDFTKSLEKQKLTKTPTTVSFKANSLSHKAGNSPSTAKPKSIFSYVTSPKSANKSSVIIEELSNESCDNSTSTKLAGTTTKNHGKVKMNGKKKLRNNEKTSRANNLNNNQDRNGNSDENCETKLRAPGDRIQVAEKYENKMSKSEKHISEMFSNIDSPYEFTRVWQSLKNDVDLKEHAQLIRSLNTDDLSKGYKLDGAMFSVILLCLEKHFCVPTDVKLLNNFLKSFSRVNRFSIVSMFMNPEDKRVIKNILHFLEEQGTADVSLLRQVYCV